MNKIKPFPLQEPSFQGHHFIFFSKRKIASIRQASLIAILEVRNESFPTQLDSEPWRVFLLTCLSHLLLFALLALVKDEFTLALTPMVWNVRVRNKGVVDGSSLKSWLQLERLLRLQTHDSTVYQRAGVFL